MNPIISLDQRSVYLPIADIATAKTRLNADASSSSTTILLQNNNGFSNGDHVIIGEIGGENSQILRITDVGIYGQTLYGESVYTAYGQGVDGVEVGVSPALKQSFHNKTQIHLIRYNRVRLYENDTVVNESSLTPDGLLSINYAVDSLKMYSISFYNSQTEVESPKGLAINGYDRLLCTAQHMRKIYSDIQTAGVSIVEKMDLARGEIKRTLLENKVEFSDFSSLEKLALPAAYLSCYYLFAELMKTEDDINSLRKVECYSKFKSTFESVLTTLQGEVEVPRYGWGSSRMIR
jgi:hypothetical protein